MAKVIHLSKCWSCKLRQAEAFNPYPDCLQEDKKLVSSYINKYNGEEPLYIPLFCPKENSGVLVNG